MNQAHCHSIFEHASNIISLISRIIHVVSDY